MLKIIGIFIAIVIVIGSIFILRDAPNELSLQISNSKLQTLLISDLKNNNIPHRVGEDEKIWYPIEYENNVNDIFNDLVNPKTSSIIISEEDHFNEVISKLEKGNIEYKIVDENEKKRIIWPNSESNSVYEILGIELVGSPSQ